MKKEHDDRNGYDKELEIISLNYSILLKSNSPKEDLKYLAELGLFVLSKVKQVDH